MIRVFYIDDKSYNDWVSDCEFYNYEIPQKNYPVNNFICKIKEKS